MSDTEGDTNPEWNKGNLSDPTDVKKQSVIIIPNQGPLTEDEEGKSPRPEQNVQQPQDGGHSQHLDDVTMEQKEESEDTSGGKLKLENESENGKGEEKEEDAEEKASWESVPPNSARSEKPSERPDDTDKCGTDPTELKEDLLHNGIMNDDHLGSIDHTLTQSMVLDEEQEAELERVMSSRASASEGHKGGQGCAMCEFCQAEAQQNKVPIKVDYNMVFRNGTKSAKERHRAEVDASDSASGYRKVYTPTSEYTEMSEIR